MYYNNDTGELKNFSQLFKYRFYWRFCGWQSAQFVVWEMCILHGPYCTIKWGKLGHFLSLPVCCISHVTWWWKWMLSYHVSYFVFQYFANCNWMKYNLVWSKRKNTAGQSYPNIWGNFGHPGETLDSRLLCNRNDLEWLPSTWFMMNNMQMITVDHK